MFVYITTFYYYLNMYIYLIHLLTEFEIGVPNESAAVDDKLFLGVS